MQTQDETHRVIILQIKVTAGAKQQGVIAQNGAQIRIKVHAIRENGKANEAALQVLANHLGVKPHQLELTKGHTTPQKLVTLRLGAHESPPQSLLPPIRLEDF